MLFKELKEDGGWITIRYAATWGYGFDFMLDAARVILLDLGADLQYFAIAGIANGSFTDITEEIMESGGRPRMCESLREECGILTVAGVSGIMECPIQVTFRNQTNTVILDIPVGQIPDGNPIKNELSENAHIFDNYMNSIEIKAYCADTERRTLERINGN